MWKLLIFSVLSLNVLPCGCQTNINSNPYKSNSDDINYFNAKFISDFLLCINVHYLGPSFRMMVRDSVSEIYLNQIGSDDDIIQKEFNLFTTYNDGDSIMSFPDINRVLMTKKEFDSNYIWYDNSINSKLSHGLVIGMKSWEIPSDAKPYKVSKNCSVSLVKYRSVIIVETYYPDYNQVSTSLYLVMNNGWLLHVPYNRLYDDSFCSSVPLDWCE
jgi:hypothetical protein